VPDISINAVANLGLCGLPVPAPVYPGDTINAVSEVIGLKENSNRKTGIVFVATTGCSPTAARCSIRALGDVHKRDEAAKADGRPRAARAGGAVAQHAGQRLPADRRRRYDVTLAGSPYPLSAITRSVSASTMSTASRSRRRSTRSRPGSIRIRPRIHFNQYVEAQGRFGRRLIYGGHVISLARSLTYMASPTYSTSRRSTAGGMWPVVCRRDVFAGARCWHAPSFRPRRCRRAAAAARRHKDRPCHDFPHKQDGQDDPRSCSSLTTGCYSALSDGRYNAS